MVEKLRRKRNGETLSDDEDIDQPTADEMKDMIEQTRKLQKQRRVAKEQAKLEAEANCEEDDLTCQEIDLEEVDIDTLTEEQKELLKAEKEEAKLQRLQDKQMNKDLQNTQGASMAAEMEASGETIAVDQQIDGNSVYQTTVLSSEDIDNQIRDNGDGTWSL